MDKLLLEDRLKACKIFYNNFHRAPRVSETMTFNNVVFKIGQFISSAKRGYYSDEVRHEIKYIFGQNVLNTNCKKSLLTVDDKINACKTFFNQFGKVPEFNDKIMVGDTSFAIGKFVKSVVNGGYSYLLPIIEQIFGKIKYNERTYCDIAISIKIQACKEFYNIYHRVPKRNETIVLSDNSVFNIGSFIHGIKYDKYRQEIAQEIINIFGPINMKIRKSLTDEEYLELITEYFELNTRIPKQNEHIYYKDIDIGSLLHCIEIKKSHTAIYERVVEILNRVRLNNNNRNEKIDNWLKMNYGVNLVN